MKRSRGRASSRPERPAGPSRRRRPRAGVKPWVGIAVVLGTAIAGVVLRDGYRREPASVAPPHPAERLSGEEAHEQAVALGNAGRHQQSLPYFRRVVAEMQDEWLAHENYSSALYNGAQESRVHLGLEGPATRSSLERIAMALESLHENDAAESLAQSPGDRATVIYQRGQSFQTWGFPVEALAEYRRAMALAPDDANLARVTSQLGSMLVAGGSSPQ